MDEKALHGAVEKAVEVLKQGGLVALPTETVYGLAADALNSEAVAKVFAAKARPHKHPLIVHLGSMEELSQWAHNIPELAWKLAKQFWPGPLTLLLQRRPEVPEAIVGGQKTIALRIPSHPVALAVLKAFKSGVVAPSANSFGHLSPTLAEHVRQGLKEKVDWVLDGGPCCIGIESTIVDLSRERPSIARPGGLSAEALAQVLGFLPERGINAQPVPGSAHAHYAPQTRLVLAKPEALESCATQLCAEGKRVAVLHPQKMALPENAQWVCIPEDLPQLAHRLYAVLHELDKQRFDVLLTSLPQADGLGSALCDRLVRAANASL
ncbi:MAG: L-threonylcarbamoyladenylate synthase [Cystobacterineae bacterium]|nr:L-threonylcarbamoyladenylate synthase [Cystobacterineae bacterium]